MELIHFIKQGTGTKEALANCTAGLTILCFCVGGTGAGGQVAVIVSGKERLVKDLKAVP
jgi:hypothetical protein